jgi:hypothetical protein
MPVPLRLEFDWFHSERVQPVAIAVSRSLSSACAAPRDVHFGDPHTPHTAGRQQDGLAIVTKMLYIEHDDDNRTCSKYASAPMPANLITLAHFSDSLNMNSPN